MGSIASTGPREGMTRAQVGGVTGLLSVVPPEHRTLREGDCVGCDQIVATTARELNCGWWIIGHPGFSRYDPGSTKHRAWFPADVTVKPKEHLARNRDMVKLGLALLATPAGPYVKGAHSGTWYTINYALRIGRPVAVIWPDGQLELMPLSFATVTEFDRLGWAA